MTDKPLSLNEQICPPHDFRAGWIDNDHGAIYCRFCGDVRPLTPQTIGPIDDPSPLHKEGETRGRDGR